jgi:hypothetical protein
LARAAPHVVVGQKAKRGRLALMMTGGALRKNDWCNVA